MISIQAAIEYGDNMGLQLNSDAGSCDGVLVQVCRSWARLCEPAFRDECHRKGWSLPRLPRGAAPAFPVRSYLLSFQNVTAFMIVAK